MAISSFSAKAILGYFGQLGFLPGNRFLVRVSPHPTSKITFLGENNIFGLMARKISSPEVDLQSISYDAGGYDAQNIQGYKPGSVNMSCFDTGKEYDLLYKYFSTVYNPQTGAYAYPDDIALDISIFEYDTTGKQREWHTYQRCFIYKFGGKEYSHDPVDRFPTFDISFLYNGVAGGMN